MQSVVPFLQNRGNMWGIRLYDTCNVIFRKLQSYAMVEMELTEDILGLVTPDRLYMLADI
jgi:hypothetical protein